MNERGFLHPVSSSLLHGLALLPRHFPQQSPPESERAKQIVALVEKAAALIDRQGRRPFPGVQAERQRVA